MNKWLAVTLIIICCYNGSAMSQASIDRKIKIFDKQIMVARKAGNYRRVRHLTIAKREFIKKLKEEPAPPSPSPNQKGVLLVCLGQSNMVSTVMSLTTLPDKLRNPQRGVMIAQQGRWVPWVPGVTYVNWGPETEFARLFSLSHPSANLYILKYAWGGSPLAQSNVLDWNVNSRNEYFDGAVRTIIGAKNMLRNVSYTIIVLWMQGESDLSPESSALYASNLSNFITTLRSNAGLGTSRFIIGRVWNHPGSDVVRHAQVFIASSLPNCRWVDTDSFPLIDRVHYSAQGQVQLGAAMYQASK